MLVPKALLRFSHIRAARTILYSVKTKAMLIRNPGRAAMERCHPWPWAMDATSLLFSSLLLFPSLLRHPTSGIAEGSHFANQSPHIPKEDTLDFTLRFGVRGFLCTDALLITTNNFYVFITSMFPLSGALPPLCAAFFSAALMACYARERRTLEYCLLRWQLLEVGVLGNI
jgi:hypothetical protein